MGCKTIRAIGAMLLGCAISGCGLGGGGGSAEGGGKPGTRTQQTDSFLKTLPVVGGTPTPTPVPAPTALDEPRQTVADRSGAIPPTVYRGDAVDNAAGRLPNGQPAQPQQQRVTSIAPAVRDAITNPKPAATTAAPDKADRKSVV